MIQINPSELRKGDTFKIQGKRKWYKAEDIFPYPLNSYMVYFKKSSIEYGRLTLYKDDILILHQ